MTSNTPHVLLAASVAAVLFGRSAPSVRAWGAEGRIPDGIVTAATIQRTGGRAYVVVIPAAEYRARVIAQVMAEHARYVAQVLRGEIDPDAVSAEDVIVDTVLRPLDVPVPLAEEATRLVAAAAETIRTGGAR